MKRLHSDRLLVCGLTALALVVLPPSLVQANAQMAGAYSQDVKLRRVETLMQTILQAPNSSAAARAYARARLQAPRSSAIKIAYVRKMVDLHRPDRAVEQAAELVQTDPAAGLPWAVVAHVDAKRGHAMQALLHLAVAVRRAPDHPFVVRTAGALIAWYDTHVDKATVPPHVREAVAMVLLQMAGHPAFVAAYQRAVRLDRAVSQKPAGPQQVAEAAVASPPTVDDAYGHGQLVNPNPFNGLYQSYLAQPYARPAQGNVQAGRWSWPQRGSTIIFPPFLLFHFHHDRD